MGLSKWLYCLVIAFVGVVADSGYAATGSTVGIPTAEDVQKIAFAGDTFRQHMHLSYPEAVGKYASPEVVSWFKKINETWWQDVPPAMVWQRLLIDSQLLITNIDRAPLLLYYSVWPDVYFITEWTIVHGEPKIVDADIVSGDWFRLSDNKEIQSAPHWSRSNMHLLDAIMESVALSLKNADKRFVKNTDADWRTLGGFDDTVDNKRLKSSQAIARTNILSNLSNVFTFQTDENKRLGTLRSAVYQMLASLYFGEINEYVFDQKLTIGSDVEKYLGSVHTREFVDGNIVAHVEEANGTAIFVAFPETPHVVLSIHLGKLQDRYRVEQLEVTNYIEAYLNVK